MDAKSMESGKTRGIILGIENSKNFKTNIKSKSFPANSAMNNQTVWSINIKNKITNTVINVDTNVFRRYLSSIFNAN